MATFRAVFAAAREMVAAVSGYSEKLAPETSSWAPSSFRQAEAHEGSTRSPYEEGGLRNATFSGSSAGPLRRHLSLEGRSRVAPPQARHSLRTRLSHPSATSRARRKGPIRRKQLKNTNPIRTPDRPEGDGHRCLEPTRKLSSNSLAHRLVHRTACPING